MKKLFLLLLALLWASPCLAVTQTTIVGDAAYTILATDINVATSVAFTTSRTWTLPSAGATYIGQGLPTQGRGYPNILYVIDSAGAITSTNTLVIAPASGETINGVAANVTIDAPGAVISLIPTSGSNWILALDYNGNVGALVTSAVASASAVALTTTTGADITTVSLTKGDWDCSAALTRKLAASTSVTQLKTSISATLNTSGSLDTGTMTQFTTAANVMGADTTMVIGPIQISLTATTTMHLVAQDTFTVSTNAGYGQLRCRRVR